MGREDRRNAPARLTFSLHAGKSMSGPTPHSFVDMPPAVRFRECRRRNR